MFDKIDELTKVNEVALKNANGQTESEFLKAYNPGKYFRPSVTVDIAIFTLTPIGELSLLLIKRGNHPDIYKWALPGGFVEKDETLDTAAARELFEETCVKNATLKQFYAFGKVDRDKRTRVISVGYFAFVQYNALSFSSGDDASAAKLFSIDTKLLAKTVSAKIYRITLSCDEIILKARVKLRIGSFGEETEFLEQGDFAGDHSHIIFAALTALKSLSKKNSPLF
ncbi:MAG: NUDIX hydrolase [Clostridia bacterium]